MSDKQFNGQWIGETQGCEMPAHIWEISQRGHMLTIKTRWEYQQSFEQHTGRINSDSTGFQIGRCEAIKVDEQHFIIPGWCTNNTRDNDGPDYDVVFSRPGLAELNAHNVWKVWKSESEETKE